MQCVKCVCNVSNNDTMYWEKRLRFTFEDSEIGVYTNSIEVTSSAISRIIPSLEVENSFDSYLCE